MKIAMISEWREPIYGWGQVHVKYLCEWLINNHWCIIDLFVRSLKDESWKIYNQNESLLDGKRKIFRTWTVSSFFSIPYRILWLIQITRILYWKTKKEKYDIIHGHALLPWIPIKIVSLLTWTPCIYTVHGTMHLDKWIKGLFYWIELYLITKIRYSAQISFWSKILSYQNTNTNIHITYWWVEVEDFDKQNLITRNWVQFLIVARIDWQKNHEQLIEAINIVDRNFLLKKWFHLNIVGDGPLKDKILQKIKIHNLESYITYKWKLFGWDKIKEYKSNQVFILPSLAEWQPLTILEAMASKLMLLVSDVGDNKVFVSQKTWIIIPPNNTILLKNAIIRILELTPKQISESWKLSYQKVQDYSWWNLCTHTYEIFQSTLRSSLK